MEASGDDDPVRFWAYLVEALRKLVPGVGEATLNELTRMICGGLGADVCEFGAPLLAGALAGGDGG